MKVIFFFLLVAMSVSMASCRVRKGCPSNGRNVGAEKILSGDPKAIKDVKKARKFKGGIY